MKKSLLTIAILLSVVACSWEDEETLFTDDVSCDTLNMSFASDVAPILRNNCFGCHSNANAPDFAFGLSLEDYEDVLAVSSRIVGAISHDSGYIPMPKGQEKLDSCQIGKIEAWINQGSLNN